MNELSIAGMVCPNNVFLAPMAGYTNAPFRALCRTLGAGLTFTEMVSAKGLHYHNAETELLLTPEEGGPRAAQIFGSDPAIMREACESEFLAPYDLIDINMGCPMPKIVKNGEGSALMENFPLAEKVISECVKSGKRISVKFRTGTDEAHKVTAEFAKLCEGSGAVMLTVHGRTRDKIYAGPCDYKEIAAAKAAVSVPVVANGDIWKRSDAEALLENTGADAVMVARAALFRPEIFSEITGSDPPPMLPLFSEELEKVRELYGERFAVVYMRKMGAFYVRGRRGAAAYKRRFFAAETSEEVAALFRELWEEV